jgi:hypothetical protein
VRVRRCTINFFLEDGTLLVKEKKESDSGIPQGVLIKRQKIPKNDREFYSLEDFNIGTEVNFFGKNIRIVNCDRFTTNFFSEQLGIELNPPEEIPVDDFTRKKNQSPPRHSQPNPHKAQLKKFLETDGKVLRFYCYWDNR